MRAANPHNPAAMDQNLRFIFFLQLFLIWPVMLRGYLAERSIQERLNQRRRSLWIAQQTAKIPALASQGPGYINWSAPQRIRR
jgi:hypothetical protein